MGTTPSLLDGTWDAPSPAAGGAAPAKRTALVSNDFLSTFRSNWLATASVFILLLVILFCWLGPVFYHTVQQQSSLGQVNQPPSGAHPLGTDSQGHDVLGRLMLGGQSSLEVGFAAAVLATVVGTVWGALAGYLGGWVDAVLMRIVDSLLAIPALLLLLVLVTITTPSIPTLILVIALVSWLPTARQVRSQALTLRTRDYVSVARCAGASDLWVVTRHIIPDVVGVIVVQATFEVANAILLLATLSFFGLGPPPPATNWGAMLSDGLNYVFDGYWWLIYPAGAAIVLTVLAVNFIGDGLRDSFDVRLGSR
jgi:peptide/nickel transport system permease protein